MNFIIINHEKVTMGSYYGDCFYTPFREKDNYLLYLM